MGLGSKCALGPSGAMEMKIKFKSNSKSKFKSNLKLTSKTSLQLLSKANSTQD
jgi:hypothetical protein